MSIMHNGEKVLNNLTTVPITQTINASSTETQVPSAKAVNTLLNNKVNKMAMLTSQNIDDLVNEGSYYIIAATNAPDAYGWVDVLANNDYTIQLFYPSITTNCEMYIRRRRECTWGKWQRVCTTSVANVPETKLTTNSWVTGSIFYTVKNGICFVRVDGLTSATMSTHSQIIVSGLPKPMYNGVWYNIAANLGSYGSLLVKLNDENLINYIGNDNVPYYGSFSYPVRES